MLAGIVTSEATVPVHVSVPVEFRAPRPEFVAEVSVRNGVAPFNKRTTIGSVAPEAVPEVTVAFANTVIVDPDFIVNKLHIAGVCINLVMLFEEPLTATPIIDHSPFEVV